MATLFDETGDVQGLIITGYGHLNHSCNFFLHIDDPAAAKQWLAGIIPQVTTAKWDTGTNGEVKKPDWALNVAITYYGLQALGQSPQLLESFPQEFQQGIAEPERSRRIGDVGGSAPARWEIGRPKLDANNQPVLDEKGMVVPDENAIHLLLMLQTRTRDELHSLRDAQRGLLSSNGLREVVEPQESYMRPDYKEHFGFHDSIAQPEIEGSPKPSPPSQTCIQAGEFVLGYRNSYNNFPSTPLVPDNLDTHNNLKPQEPETVAQGEARQKDFGRNGSYVVFRKLYQDVAAFRRYFRDNGKDAEDSELLKAKCMGRWPSGTPLVLSPDFDDRTLGKEFANDFLYMETDPNGYKCPIGSHIRRANPRDSRQVDPKESIISVNRHRIIRRGMPYGPELPEGVYEDDGVDRGLLFFLINADIARQFEFIQNAWLDDPKFNSFYHDKDPIVGSNYDPLSKEDLGPWDMTIQREPVRRTLKNLPRFVWVKGGAYFFLPSISALSFLAGVPKPPQT